MTRAVANAAALAVVPWCLATSLKLYPPGISLPGPGSTQRILVMRELPGGYSEDVTSRAILRSSDPRILSVEPSRCAITGQGRGLARLTVQLAGEAATATVRVGERTSPPTVSFSSDVLSILTTKGCNSSSCHGSPAGQNGFKLSLFGYDVSADHRMILQEHSGRRVNMQEPATSLLLRKPAFEVAHGGGNLLGKQSDEYRTILNWLEQGAPLDSGGARLERIELHPAEQILTGAGTRQSMVVIGRLSDGTTHDMTSEVRYSVEDTGVITEPKDATVTAAGPGLTTLMARGMGKTATAQYIVIPARPDWRSASPVLASNNFIDTLVFGKLRKVNAIPYPLTTDRAFVRRVHLDVIGQLPTTEETRRFLDDSRPDKRARLIDELLERPEYASHWMVKFEDWFRNHQFNSQGRTNASFKRWIRDTVEQDRPYNETVRELLTSLGDTTVRPAGNFWHPAIDFMLKTFDVNKITPTVTRLFLGVRIECAECHNHPLENLTQDDFYGMAAFFARLKVKHGYAQYRRIWYNEREGEVIHPVSKKPVAPKFLGGPEAVIPTGTDRRTVLASLITAHPQFAQATVNRIWTEYFGTGIVEPHDDFRSTNRPSNPALLEELARHFVAGGHRFKPLHRLILNSRVYQTASRAEDRPGQSSPLERRLYARYEPRRLSAEVLLDAIGQVTGVPHEFRPYPAGTSAKELVASNGPDYFLVTFGFPRRDVLADRVETPSLAQALHLMNSDTIRNKVEAKQNILTQLAGQGLDDRAIIENLWERGLARPPSANEWDSLLGYVSSERSGGRDRRRALEHVLWVLLNSKEFRINQ
jgi:hypothetical protein